MSTEKKTIKNTLAIRRANGYYSSLKKPLAGQTLPSGILVKGRATSSQVRAQILDVKASGLVVALDENSVTYTFRANKAQGYFGQSFEEAGIFPGAKVRISKRHGVVSSFLVE
jgi:hypothetical protein